MSFTALLDQVGEIFTRSVTGVSELGNDITSVTSAGVWACHVQPVAEQEELSDRAQQVTTHAVWFDPNAPLNGADYFVVDGARFELVGEPQMWRDPRTQVDHHIECTVRRVTDGNTF